MTRLGFVFLASVATAFKLREDTREFAASPAVASAHPFDSLENKCLEISPPGKFRYEVCFFDSVTSYEEGYPSTSLGSYTSMTQNTQDDPNAETWVNFEGGTMCGGGPARSTRVKFVCGVNEALLSFEEPETCVYEGTVSHPSACTTTTPAPVVTSTPAPTTTTTTTTTTNTLIPILYSNLQAMQTQISQLNLALDTVQSKLTAAETAAAASNAALQANVGKLVTLQTTATHNNEKVVALSTNAKTISGRIATNTEAAQKLQTEVTTLTATAQELGVAAADSSSKLGKLEQLVKDVIPGDESVINNRLTHAEETQKSFEQELKNGIGADIKDDLKKLTDSMRDTLTKYAQQAAASFG